MNIKEEYQKFLYEWVKKNFGQSEADDPSWSIEALADALSEKYWGVRHKHELENIKNDILMVAHDNDIDLTEQEAYTIADEYEYSEAYCTPDRESIKYFINHFKGEA